MIKKIYDRKCLNCKKKFKPTSATNTVCSQSCAIEYAKEKAIKQKAKNNALEKQKLKNSITGVPELKKLLETQINAICREIDKGSGCISCGGHTTPQGGHFFSKGSNPALRYNLFNIYLQDYNCNCAKGGNIHEYDKGLIKMYGKQHWEFVKFELPLKYTILKPTKPELLEWIEKAKIELKILKKENRTYDFKERIEIRKLINERIGIYV